MKNTLRLALALLFCVVLCLGIGAAAYADNCTIIFNSNGGNGSMDPQVVAYGGTVTLNANTYYRANYIFTGWNTKADGSGSAYADQELINIYNFGQSVTLYAQWATAVVFDKNHPDAVGYMAPQEIELGTTVILDPNGYTLQNHAFDRWSDAPDGGGMSWADEGDYYADTSRTLYAQWVKTHYAVNYDKNGGGGRMSSTNALKNTLATVKWNEFNAPNSSLIFVEWNTDPNGWGDRYLPGEMIGSDDIPSDITLYAIWRDKLQIWVYPGDAEGEASSWGVPKGTPVTLPRPTEFGFTAPDGQIFAGWMIDGDLYRAGDEYVFDYDKSLVAQWTEKIKVTYDANGGTPASPRKVQYIPKNTPAKIATINAVGYTHTGYKFLGWALVPTAVTPKYVDGDTVSFSSDTTLFAIWEQTSFVGYVEIIGSESGYMNSAYCGETLTCTVTGENKYSVTEYQWLAGGADIPGATNASYTPTENDFGKAIVCVVYTDAPENASRESNTKYVTIDAEGEKELIDNGMTQNSYIFGVTSDMSYSIDNGERQAVMIDDMHRMPVSKKGIYIFYKGSEPVGTISVANWYTLAYEITRVSNFIPASSSSSSSSSSSGSGTVRMYNGGTQLTMSTRITDMNGNIIIRGNGSNTWLVREGASTDLKMVVTPASGSYVHVSLNGGDYTSSSAGTERIFSVSPVTEPTRFEIVFSREANYPPVPVASIDEENFPDPVFRRYVLTNFDRDGDGMLSDYEISIIRNISVTNMGIASLKGIEYFAALQSLYCANNSLSSLDVLSCPVLTYLSCSGNALTSLDLSGCPALSTLYCSDNVLTELDLSVCPALTVLECSGNLLMSIDLSGNPELQTLHCYDNLLSSLGLDGNPALGALYCQGNLLTALDLGGKTALTSLTCSGNLLSWLDVSGCARLRTLNCEGNELAALDLSGCGALSTLNCYGNTLASLDLNDCTSLRRLSCANNSLTSIDVGGYSLLTTLTCQSNHLEELHVKNCPALKALTCQRNALTELDLGGCDALLTLIQNVNPAVAGGVVSYGVNSSGSAILSFDDGIRLFFIPETGIILPAGLTDIEPEAFAGSEFDSLYIPDSVTSIAEDAFGDRTSLTIIGVPGSTAEVFAQAHGFDFVPAA